MSEFIRVKGPAYLPIIREAWLVEHSHFCERCGAAWSHRDAECMEQGMKALDCPEHFYAGRHTGSALPYEHARLDPKTYLLIDAPIAGSALEEVL